MEKEKDVMRIGCGGSGSEAKVYIELRTTFPGIGGRIETEQAVTTAFREEHSKSSKMGHRNFLKHMIIKKIEDYFHRRGLYKFPHIPRPLGSISVIGKQEAYIYEWAFGEDNFPWGYQDIDRGFVLIPMRDWSEFGAAFRKTGINLTGDCTDSDDGRISQNIIHQYYKSHQLYNGEELNPLWKRIDFGCQSIKIDYDKLRGFLKDEEKKLREVLRSERYEMMVLSLEYLVNKKMSYFDIGRLDSFVGNYRLSSLRHHISRGTGTHQRSVARISSRGQSLL